MIGRLATRSDLKMLGRNFEQDEHTVEVLHEDGMRSRWLLGMGGYWRCVEVK